MKRTIKRIFSILICITMLISSALFSFGCKSNSIETFDEYTEYNQLRFYCYGMPPLENTGTGAYANNPSFRTEEQYKYIAECGFNYAMIGDGSESGIDTRLAALESLKKHDIKVIIYDNALASMMDLYISGSTDSDDAIKVNKETFKESYKSYNEFENFAGVHISDEPSRERFEAIGKVYDFYRTVEPVKDYKVNLLCYSTPDLMGTDSYDTYVKDALDMTKMTKLCFDSYPLNKDGTVKEAHISNCFDIATAAQAKGVDWECYVLTYEHLYYLNPKNYDDIAWQVYTAMAHGCKGFYPFVYFTPLTNSSEAYAMIGRDGKPTQIYYSMQEVIKEIRAFESMYMNSEWTGTLYHVADPDYPNDSFDMVGGKLESHQRISNIKAKSDIMIGTFKDIDNRDAFLITSAAAPSKDIQNEVTITFNNASKAVLYKKGRKIIVNLKDGQFSTTIGSGEGYYVIPLQ